MFDSTVIFRAGRACLTSAARLLPAARALPRDTRGVAAVEFALLATPLFLLLVGIVEVSLMYFTNSVMEGATKEVARQIRTGQIQESGDPVATFQSNLCDALFNVIDCGEVIFNVQTFDSFANVSMTIEVDEDGEVVNTGFNPGGAAEITVVRTIYRWNFITPLISEMMPQGLGGHMLISTVAFQNEPY